MRTASSSFVVVFALDGGSSFPVAFLTHCTFHSGCAFSRSIRRAGLTVRVHLSLSRIRGKPVHHFPLPRARITRERRRTFDGPAEISLTTGARRVICRFRNSGAPVKPPIDYPVIA